MDDDLLVTVDDLRDLRGVSGKLYCVKGVRLWFSTHGIDFNEFVRAGIPAQKFLDTKDVLAEELVNAARERRHGQ